MTQSNDRITVYVGTYTKGDSEGIYTCQFNPATGELRLVGDPAPITDPSFLAVDSKRRFLYSVSEAGDAASGSTGSVTAFAISDDGRLEYLNTQPSGSDGPCHVSVDATDRQVLVANYGGGSVAILPIRGDGSLGEPTDVVPHRGSGPNPDRQQGPHPHSINVDPTNRFAFVPDLGTDEVVAYRLNLVLGLLTPEAGLTASLAAGAGPRHFDFHPGGGYAYAINELDSTVTAFSYDGSTGTLKELHTVSTLPDGFEGTNYPADVYVSPSGRFLYGSNRGHHSIAIFAIDGESGMLTPIGHESTRGEWPRNFVIDPTGAFMLVANEHTDDIVTFRIDGETGLLEATGHVEKVPSPVCLLPVPR
jgi:6-phosphogluconolactonase